MDIFLIFQQPLHWLIVNLTDATGSYGLAIILFTLIIRTILAPLYAIQMRSSKKMMALSPRIKELQRRHGKDRETLTKATMELYKEHNVNPALGCVLPLLQLPILWSLFLVLRNLAHSANYLQTHHIVSSHYSLYTAHFLWLDLGKPDPYHILPIVAGITQWIQQRMMLNPSNDPQQRQMNQIMQFMPLMIVAFAWAYPSGLAIYWVTSNIYMMVLQYFIGGWGQLFTHPFSIPTAPAGTPPPPAPARDGGFLARAFAPRQDDPPPTRPAPNGRTTRTVPEKEQATSTPDGDMPRTGKMERYAARHGRAATRGRAGAKGAKK